MQRHASEMFRNERDIVHAGKEGGWLARGKRIVTKTSYRTRLFYSRLYTRESMVKVWKAYGVCM